ncbi:hypothetical protein AAFG38_01825 [Lacticaseibacillus rhamnosus]|uniref:hypothetical protein n=1 Tax=Lacticaseibacillus rhamnosus TaxID=47715 RepID=UPI00338DA9C6
MKRLNQKILQIGYMFFVFISVMSLSSWDLFFAGVVNFNTTMLILCLAILVLGAIVSDWTIARMYAFVVFSVLLLIYFQLYQGSYLVPILLSLMLGTGLQVKDVLKCDFYSRLVSVGFVIILSLFSILPKSGYGANLTDFHFTIFSYGFTYTNIFAFELAVLFVECLLVFKNKMLFKFLLMIFMTVVEILMGYETGAVFCVVGFFVYFTTRGSSGKMTNLYLTMSTLLVPIFSLFSIHVAKMFSSTNNFWNRVNDLLSGRAAIWQYYYQAMPIKFWGNGQTINQKTMGVVGFGAFDGVFIQFLLTFGIMSILLLFLLLLLVTLKKHKGDNKRLLAVLILPLVLSGFTETNGFLATFSPFYVMIASYLFSVPQVAYSQEKSNLEDLNKELI